LHVNFDGYPFPSSDARVFLNADFVVTSSSFARDVLVDACPELARKTTFMYSPADIVRFRPVNDEEKVELRRDLFPKWLSEGTFVLGWVGRNQWRKQVWLLYAVLNFLRSGKYLICLKCNNITTIDWHPGLRLHTDEIPNAPNSAGQECRCCSSNETMRGEAMKDIVFWLHIIDPGGEGDWPLRELEVQFNVKPGRDLHYTEGLGGKAALSPTDVPSMFQLWDGLLYLSGGEGFGLPAWEAMCTGLPVIYSDYSSHAEFLRAGNAGLPVKGIMQPEAKSCEWRLVADVAAALKAVRRLYYDRNLGKMLGHNGRVFVHGFVPSMQAERWHHIFQKVLGNCESHPTEQKYEGVGP
jgi:glycosyltransferase involved in cell wall biosynthesis